MPTRATITPDQFQQVLEVSRLLAVTTELDPLLSSIAQSCCVMLGCERASIFLHDANSGELWTKIALGSKEIRVPSHAGIVGHVFKSNELFHCREPYKDARFNPEPDRRSGFVTRNLLTAPMVDLKRNPIGVIQAVNKTSAGAFSESDESLLQLLADQAGVAVQRYHLQQAEIEGLALRKEMDLARMVQEALIPRTPPVIENVSSIGWTLSASITGGDCYDLWKLPSRRADFSPHGASHIASGNPPPAEAGSPKTLVQSTGDRLGIFLGDASGHGIAPALVVSQARVLIRAMCNLDPDPHRLLEIANARLAEDLEAGRFVTAFVAILEPSGLLHWSSAGHGPVLMRRAPGAPIETLDPPGPPLGVMPEFLADPVDPVELSPGGLLLVMSDGIFEAPNPAGEMFGVERVLEILSQRPTAQPAELLEAIRGDVQRWQGKLEPIDDQTVVIAQRV